MNAPIASPYLDIPVAPYTFSQQEQEAQQILECVGHSFQVGVKEIIGGGRRPHLARARIVAYWLLRTLTQITLSDIGRIMQKDHTSVRAGYRHVIQLRASDAAFCAFTDQLSAAIVGRLSAQ